MTNFLKKLYKCDICPVNCKVDRRYQTGACKTGINPIINLWQKHFGEEPIISGIKGSGTIFFSGCNMRCVYCQNYKISQKAAGREYSIEEIAEIMLDLQKSGVHNINLVTPTHNSIQLMYAIQKALSNGLSVPVVWNTSSYEKAETLKILSGYVDIYLADIRYFSSENAKKYSFTPNYPKYFKTAITEMYKQVGDIIIGENNVAVSGLIIRILVLPNNANDVENILKWIKENIGNQVYISLMSQYYPAYKAYDFKEISRGITKDEYDKVLEIMNKLGFENGFIQEIAQTPDWTPNFKE
jgi:putative pyruvate formate lyase activating enzyme